MTTEKPILAIVVPCFNEEEELVGTNQQLSQLISELVQKGMVSDKSRIAYVDDGSTDATWTIVENLCHDAPSVVCGVKLSANSGHQNALMAGLEAMLDSCDIFVTIDADLQDDIAAIPTMIEKWAEGCDIVYGVRNKRRTDSWFKRTTAVNFYRFMRHCGIKMVYNHADFRLMSKRAVTQLMRYPERNLFLRGIVPLLGYRTAEVAYDRKERTAGKSKYSLSKMIGFAVDGITSFSVRPVRMVLNIGVVFIIIAILILAYVLYSKFSGHAVTGWASMILSLWFIGGCVLIGLGIVGEYIGKIYMEVKARPRYNVEQKLNIEDKK